MIDHYGPGVPIGGKRFLARTPHKVDKCGALRARQLAKKFVRGGVDEARVTLGWAPGRCAVPRRMGHVRWTMTADAAEMNDMNCFAPTRGLKFHRLQQTSGTLNMKRLHLLRIVDLFGAMK